MNHVDIARDKTTTKNKPSNTALKIASNIYISS